MCRGNGALFALVLAVLSACGPGAPAGPLRVDSADHGPAVIADSSDAVGYDAELATTWVRLSLDLTHEEGMTSVAAARAWAYLGVGLWEAVAPGIPAGRSLAGQLNGLTAMPPAGDDLHWPTVANAVMGDLMRSLYRSPSSARSIRALERSYDDRFRRHVAPGRHGRSLVHARRVATSIRRWADTDGYRDPAGCPYALLTGHEDEHPSALPCADRLRPFVLTRTSACAPAPRESARSAGAAFHDEAVEVYRTSTALTPAQRAKAHFWADATYPRATPAAHWLSITAQVLREIDAPLEVAAEAFARVGIGEADALRGCPTTSYAYALLHPAGYIRTLVDETWTPALQTPAFVVYTPGHLLDTGVSATILTRMLGDEFAFTDHTHEGRGIAPRTFASFADAARESALARLYAGMHYRADIEAALARGACVSGAVNGLLLRSARDALDQRTRTPARSITAAKRGSSSSAA